MPKPEEEKKVLHHYQGHREEDGVTYTIDVYRIVKDGAVSYEIQMRRMPVRAPFETVHGTTGRYESDSFSEHFTDHAKVNATFLELIGMHVK